MQAPAKLNRFLAVLGRLPDGFHELELVTTVLDGVEGLDGHPGGGARRGPLPGAGRAHVRGPARPTSATWSSRPGGSWSGRRGATCRPRLRLLKRIPHGAGLGGGSSDAAAALRLGDALFGLGLGPRPGCWPWAPQLGSDVPLFLLGGTVLGLDRGERVFPLRPIPLEPILLAHPGLYVATPSVYKSIAQVGYPVPEPCASLARGARPRTGATTSPARPSGPARPWPRCARPCRTAAASRLLCGSGSCWAARYPDAGQRDAARDRLAAARPAGASGASEPVTAPEPGPAGAGHPQGLSRRGGRGRPGPGGGSAARCSGCWAPTAPARPPPWR